MPHAPPSPQHTIATVTITDPSHLVLPRACLASSPPFRIAAGDRLLVTGDNGETVAGIVAVVAGVPVLELEAELDGASTRATVRRPRQRSAA